MTTAALTTRGISHRPLDIEVATGLEHVRDLVCLRRIFAERGATDDELRVCDAEIDRYRRRIARLTRAASEPLKAA
jgi:hypothetical protein